MRTTLYAEGKINIGLIVGEKREDGYHNIESYMLRTDTSDRIRVNIVDSGCTIMGNDSYLMDGEVDLMEKAYNLYKDKSGLEFGLKIKIEKHIPVKAGFGGGSSDAASILLFLNDTYKNFSKEELLSLALLIGSDVPFFVSGYKCALVKGRGEIIEEKEDIISPYYQYIYFGRIGTPISTKDAFSALDKINRKKSSLPPLRVPLEKKDYPNDFEELFSKRDIGNIREFFVSLTGSGDGYYILTNNRIAAFDNSIQA